MGTSASASAKTKPEQDDLSVNQLVGIAVLTLIVVFTFLYNISPHEPRMEFNPDPAAHYKAVAKPVK